MWGDASTHPSLAHVIPYYRPNHPSGRETNRGTRPSENTVTTYLCGIRVFLDCPGVVPLPSPKLASKCVSVFQMCIMWCIWMWTPIPSYTPTYNNKLHRRDLKKYLVLHGAGLFGQWAKGGFKVGGGWVGTRVVNNTLIPTNPLDAHLTPFIHPLF